MSLILSGTDGVADVDGSAATPAIRGTDANTGIFFPAADTIAFSTAGTEDARFDASGNLMIGTTTQISKLTIAGGVALSGGAGVGNAFYPYYNSATSYNAVSSDGNGGMTFITGISAPAVRATIDNSGNLRVGTTSDGPIGSSRAHIFGPDVGLTVASSNVSAFGITAIMQRTDASGGEQIRFVVGTNTTVGSIFCTSTATAYNTSSDYRLKNTIAPMTGALAKVALLKPCTYKWNADGSNSEGFIAHELAEVCPQAVSGEKDAVDAKGNPQYQGFDASFLVATLTAALQEAHGLITALTARVEALEGAQP
jgi:hypothetical protein